MLLKAIIEILLYVERDTPFREATKNHPSFITFTRHYITVTYKRRGCFILEVNFQSNHSGDDTTFVVNDGIHL